MEPIVIIVGLVASFFMFEIAAFTNGADSRDTIADDHRR
jgi:hypothetical protein